MTSKAEPAPPIRAKTSRTSILVCLVCLVLSPIASSQSWTSNPRAIPAASKTDISVPATEEPDRSPGEVPGDQATEPFSIAVISDLNERYGDQFYRDTVHSAVRSITALSPDLVIVLGDMVAGQRVGLDYSGMWAAFHSAVTEPLDSFPLVVVPGNHDASSYDRYTLEREIYRNEWLGRTRPWEHPGVQVVDDTDYPFRYALTLGPVLLVVLDTTQRNALDDRGQLDWLANQLSSEAARRCPVRIVAAHFPLYPVAQGREQDYLLADPAVRRQVEAMFQAHEVTLFLSGHHHVYYPGYHPATGLRLTSVGCLGGGPRVLLGDERRIEDTDDPTERSFVVIEAASDGIHSIEAYRGPDFGPADRISRDSLPACVGLGAFMISRDDLHGPAP